VDNDVVEVTLAVWASGAELNAIDAAVS